MNTKIKNIILIGTSLLGAVFLSNLYADNLQPYNRTTGVFLSVAGIPPFVGSANIGYQFTPNFGIQAGAFGVWGTFTGFDVDTASIYDIAMRGVLPLGNRVELFGKLGVGVINAQETITLPWFGTTKQSGESVGPTYGLGLGFCFTPHWMMTLEGAGIYTAGSQVIRSGFKTIPMIGLTYHFGG